MHSLQDFNPLYLHIHFHSQCYPAILDIIIIINRYANFLEILVYWAYTASCIKTHAFSKSYIYI